MTGIMVKSGTADSLIAGPYEEMIVIGNGSSSPKPSVI